MPAKLSHFAIEADDVDRAKAFYEAVFEWTLAPWGPPNFYRFQDAGVHGALQERREPMPAGRKGIELSFAVDDLSETSKKITAEGGAIVSEAFTIPGVGQLCSFRDTEGNEAMIIEYEDATRREMGL